MVKVIGGIALGKDYELRLRCPHGDNDCWVTLWNREESLEQILHMFWDFDCSVHGVQREVPMEGHEKVPPPRSSAQLAKLGAIGTRSAKARSSERASLSIPVVVYGWSKNQGSFHEISSTLRVNDSGGLVPLAAKVELGETLFLMNKSTREEQGIRVVFVEAGADGKQKVGFAFHRPDAEFWKKKQRKARYSKTLRVFVKGDDRSGNPFVQSAYTIDVSKAGARLDGFGYLTHPGKTVEVKRFWRKARFRVVWIGEMGTPEANQVGILCLEEEKNPLRSKLPDSEKKSED